MQQRVTFEDIAMPTNHKEAHGAAARAANLGIMRPPLVYLVAIIVGVAIDIRWPLTFLPGAITGPIGSILVLAAIVLFVYAVRTFRAAGTSVRGNQPTTTIVRSGPYRFTRNPIYVAFSLLQFGLAIWINSLWLIITLIGAIALMAYVVIPREESYLERRFGAEYRNYQASVRRWL